MPKPDLIDRISDFPTSGKHSPGLVDRPECPVGPVFVAAKPHYGHELVTITFYFYNPNRVTK